MGDPHPAKSHTSAFDPKRTFATAEHFSGLGNMSKASAAGWALAFALLPLPAPAFGVQFKAAPYRLRTAIHRLPISSCGAAANVAPHFHKAAALTGWCRSHSRMAAYLHGIRSFRVPFRSNAVAVSPLVMHISATTVNDRIMRLLALPPPLDL